jgi:outer membrane receptor for ferrienterochelin and colicins
MRVILAATLVVGATQVGAQGVGTSMTRPDSARMTSLPAVITTAGLRETRAAEVPASTTVIRRAEIEARAAVSADQLLRELPGLQQVPVQPSRTSISIRGLDGPRVLVLIDGEPAAGAASDTRDIGRLSTVAAERIEVIRGPAGVEFGSDALGGVINLVTAAPSPQLSMEATARGGGLGRLESGAEVSNTVGPLGFRLSGGWRQGDRVTGVNATGSTLDRVYDIRGDARVARIGPMSVRASGQWSRERQRWPVGGGFNGFIDDHSAQGFVEGSMLTRSGLVRARFFAQTYSYAFRQARGDSPIAGTADSLRQSEDLLKALVAWSGAVGSHTLDLGAQGVARKIRAPEKIGGDTATDRVGELFARDSWTLGNLRLVTGGRLTSSSLWGSAFTPSIGGIWTATDAGRLRANVARGFRGPGFKEARYTFANPSGGYVVEGNPDLEPESSWSTSVGALWSRGALTVDAELYRNNVERLIDIRAAGTNVAGLQVFRNVNVARARMQGAELAIRGAIGTTSYSLGYNYLDARNVETGEALDRKASHSASLRASRMFVVLSGLHLDGGARFTGASRLGDETQGSFLSFDAQARLRLIASIELSIGGNNLLNARPALWTPAYERQLFAGARWRIGSN